jgi:hypothetical protein
VSVRTLVLCAVFFATMLGAAPAHGFIYWGGSDGSIHRMNNDGTGLFDGNFRSDRNRGQNVVVTDEKVFWSNGPRIQQATIEGDIRPDLAVAEGTGSLTGLAIYGRFLYWASPSGRIGRANIDGTAFNTEVIQTFVNTGPGDVHGVAVGPEGIFWGADTGIGRANLDGSSPNPQAIEIDPSSLQEHRARQVVGGALYWDSFPTASGRQLRVTRPAGGGVGETAPIQLGGYGVGDWFIHGGLIYFSTGPGTPTLGTATLAGDVLDDEPVEQLPQIGVDAVDDRAAAAFSVAKCRRGSKVCRYKVRVPTVGRLTMTGATVRRHTWKITAGSTPFDLHIAGKLLARVRSRHTGRLEMRTRFTPRGGVGTWVDQTVKLRLKH